MKTETLEKLLHENECTYLDFKRDQYPFAGATDEVKSELLKDILALANVEKQGDGYILIGVAEVRGGRSKVCGVTSHLSDSDLQQFVNFKTQKPITFSYKAVPCDGLSIGVLHIPRQDSPIFLKADYGKLRRNIVYYRLGSSTKEATPEELVRWGHKAATEEASPKLDLGFAHIKHHGVLAAPLSTKPAGVRIKVETRRCSEVPQDLVAKLAPPAPQMAVSYDHEYFQGFCKFVRVGSMLAPVGLYLINKGEVTASGIVVRLIPRAVPGLLLRPQDQYPVRPLHRGRVGANTGGLFASHSRLALEDIAVTNESGRTEIEWRVEKAIPQLPVISQGVFFIGAQESCTVEFEGSVFGENVRQPILFEMTIQIEESRKDLTVEEIQALSEALRQEDRRTGTGRVA